MSSPDLLRRIQELRRFIEACDFAGYDPYDALNSPLVRLLTFGTAFGRIAWIQFFRRCPINLRAVLGVPQQLNAKALGLCLEAYCKLYAQGHDSKLLGIIEDLVSKLECLCCGSYNGAGWGYPFNWQSRAAFVPAGTPTIVNTAFVGHALLDCHERTGSTRVRELALRIPDFLLQSLHRKEAGNSFCFSYTPLDRNFVHNANMLGASLLLRLGRLVDNSCWVETAGRSMAYSVERQRPDGSWPYAETEFQRWVDSFHTGFNLEALRWFIRLKAAPEKWMAAYDRGAKFYAANFFLPDGTPKYYHDRTYPVDIHAPAEAVCFFSGEGETYRELTNRVLDWMLKNLWDQRKGYFYFRKTPLGTNRIPYMRWSQAWGYRALTSALFRCSVRGE